MYENLKEKQASSIEDNSKLGRSGSIVEGVQTNALKPPGTAHRRNRLCAKSPGVSMVTPKTKTRLTELSRCQLLDKLRQQVPL